ncbi:MAG: heavy-metal-associated domain-containing protein [Thiobacillus sp.]|nr:heavy-metal-associated domain-containing protein [Thiobacillus sp.]
MNTITLPITGMTCGGCVNSVTRVLKALPGVDDVEVTLSPGQAKVTFDPARTERAQLEKAIVDAGFSVGR